MKIEDLKRRIKENKFLFFNYKKLTSADYKNGYKAYLKGCFKSESEVKRELALLKNYWQCDPMHYFRYRLFEKKLTDNELLNYIPPYFFYTIYMKNILKDVDDSLFDSKLFLNKFFNERGINTPKFIAEINNRTIFSSNRKTISFQNLEEELIKSTSSKFFLKPDKGSGGYGIVVITKNENKLHINNKIFTEKLLLKIVKSNAYILQEGIQQREDFSKMHSASVNTLRVITQCDGVNFNMPVAVLRMGRSNSYLDNSCQGGISVNINITTGELNEFAYIEHGSTVYKQHPDSGFVFKNFKIKGWDLIKQKIENYTRKIIEIKEFAWDIAILDNDLYAIEININYALDHLQCAVGGIREKLNITPN